MTQWMKTQFTGPQQQQIQCICCKFPFTRYNSTTTMDSFRHLKDPAEVSGLDYIKDADKFNYTTNINNSDTGSIRGSDAGGSTSYGAQDVIPDANGAPQGSYVEEEVDDPEPLVLGGGVSLNLSAISPVSFGDTSTYNLETESGAKLVMDRVDELIELITNSLSQVGSNMGQLSGANIVTCAILTGKCHIPCNEVSLPEESMHLAKSDILINSNLMMRAQAKAIQQDVMLTLIS